jgi:hypothetical protein
MLNSGYSYILAVCDFDRAVQFYDKLFSNVQVEYTEDTGVKGYSLKGFKVYIELRSVAFERTKPFYWKKAECACIDPISIELSSRSMVDEFYAVTKEFKLNDRRVPREYLIQNNDQYTFYFNDPEGFPLEVYAR